MKLLPLFLAPFIIFATGTPMLRGEEPARNPALSGAYQVQDAFHSIYEEYRPSVVFIATERTVREQTGYANDPFLGPLFGNNQGREEKKHAEAMGTGFVISADGYVCTNHHVVAGADSIRVRVEDREYPAKLVGSDKLTDIALLKVEGITHLRPVKFGDSDRVRVGDWAIAIGNPFGLDRTFTVGVISAVARRGLDDLGSDHLQTDASINPGNSGGPLINLAGEVVGMNRMILSQSGGSAGIGFAIPSNRVKEIVEQLKAHGRIHRGFIGARVKDLTPELAKELKSPVEEGVFVALIVKNFPAANAGLRPGDVIQTADGKPVPRADDFVRLIMATPVGNSLRLGISRQGKAITLDLTVGERPNQ